MEQVGGALPCLRAPSGPLPVFPTSRPRNSHEEELEQRVLARSLAVTILADPHGMSRESLPQAHLKVRHLKRVKLVIQDLAAFT